MDFFLPTFDRESQRKVKQSKALSIQFIIFFIYFVIITLESTFKHVLGDVLT